MIPTQTYAEVEVADTEVEGVYGSLMMVVKHSVTALAFRIDVDVAMTVIVGEGRTRETQAMRVVQDLTTSQHPLTQTERDVGTEVHGLVQRQVRIQLQGHHFLRIEAEA